MATQGVRVAEATPEHAAALAGMTWSAYRPFLSLPEETRTAARAVILAAWIGEIPIGLAISRGRGAGADEQELLSLFVVPQWRRRGVARALLAGLRTALAGSGAVRQGVQYSSRLPCVGPWQSLLQADGWAAPEVVSLRICGPVRETFSVFRHRAALIERLGREGFAIRTWREDGARAVAVAAQLRESGEAPDWSAPDSWLDALDPDASMVLVDETGDVRGWVVCQHQPALNRWFFPIGWVREPQAGRGWLLGAYAEGARRLAEAHGDDTEVVVESYSGLPQMWRVLERHFVPYARWSDNLMHSYRALG